MITTQEYRRLKNLFKEKWKDQIWLDDTPKETAIAYFRDKLEMCKLEIEILGYFLEDSNVPFTSDQIWLWGKFKGKKLDQTPRSYLEWALANMDLTPSHARILNGLIEETFLTKSI